MLYLCQIQLRTGEREGKKEFTQEEPNFEQLNSTCPQVIHKKLLKLHFKQIFEELRGENFQANVNLVKQIMLLLKHTSNPKQMYLLFLIVIGGSPHVSAHHLFAYHSCFAWLGKHLPI